MSNLSKIPLQDGFRTTLSEEVTTLSTTFYVNDLPIYTPSTTDTYAVIDPGKTTMEIVVINDYSSSPSDNLTVTRAQSLAFGVAGTAYSHGVGAEVIISDNFAFWNDILTAMNSKFDGNVQPLPSYADAAARNAALGASPATNGWIVGLTAEGKLTYSFGGAWLDFGTGATFTNASESAAGKVQQATLLEMWASTEFGSTGAPLFVNPKNLKKTPSPGSADQNKIPVMDSSGTINSFVKADKLTTMSTPEPFDAFIVGDHSDSYANKNLQFYVLKNSLVKSGGNGSDGSVSGAANVTITGSNDTIIEKNYITFFAGSAPRTYTITPTGCVHYLRVQGDADFTNWMFDFDGKGKASGSTAFFPSTAGGGGGQSGTGTGGGGGGGASCTTSGAAGTAGGGGTSGGAGGTTSASFSTTLFPQLKKDYSVDVGSPGGNGIQSGGATGGLGGAGGGCLIIEVGGNLNLGSSTINARGANGTVVASGWGGGGGGAVIIFYSGTLTGSATINVNGGTGGTGTGGNGSGGNGGAGVTKTVKNTYIA